MAKRPVDAGHLGLVLLTMAVLLAQGHAQTTRSPASHFACPDEWEEHEGVCLFVSSTTATQTGATSACSAKGAYLVNILSVSRNQFVQGLIPNISTPVWIGLMRNADRYSSYSSSSYSSQSYTWRGQGGSTRSMGVALWSTSPSTSRTYSPMCVIMKSDGMWYGDQSCSSSSYRYICEKKPDCAAGWTGTTCSERCHCASFTCGSSYSRCPYGCQPGWTGSKCNQEKERPEVVYYCQNTTELGPRLVLRVDVKGVNYADFRSLNEQDEVEGNCGKSNFVRSSNPEAYSLIVPAPSSLICPGFLVANTTWTYRWKFWLAEFKNVLSEHDFLFTATCDFTQAETMQRPAQFSLSSVPSGKVVPLAQSHEEVRLQVIDPDTTSDLQPLSSAIIGTRVRLAMTLTRQPGIRAKGISPKNCMVSSSDGSETYNITDSKGCATSETPISKLSGNGSLQQTEVFSIFGFRQAHDLVFTCSFDFCFSDSDSNCTDRCTAFRNRYSRYRGKRSASYSSSPDADSGHFVSAAITVFPRELPSRDRSVAATSAAKRSSPAVVAVAVMAVVLVVLVAATALYTRARCSRGGRGGWTAVPQRPEPF